MEVFFDSHVEYHRLEDVVSDPAEPPSDRSGEGLLDNGPRDALQHSKPETPFQNQEKAAGLNSTK